MSEPDLQVAGPRPKPASSLLRNLRLVSLGFPFHAVGVALPKHIELVFLVIAIEAGVIHPNLRYFGARLRAKLWRWGSLLAQPPVDSRIAVVIGRNRMPKFPARLIQDPPVVMFETRPGSHRVEQVQLLGPWNAAQQKHNGMDGL